MSISYFISQSSSNGPEEELFTLGNVTTSYKCPTSIKLHGHALRSEGAAGLKSFNMNVLVGLFWDGDPLHEH